MLKKRKAKLSRVVRLYRELREGQGETEEVSRDLGRLKRDEVYALVRFLIMRIARLLARLEERQNERASLKRAFENERAAFEEQVALRQEEQARLEQRLVDIEKKMEREKHDFAVQIALLRDELDGAQRDKRDQEKRFIEERKRYANLLLIAMRIEIDSPAESAVREMLGFLQVK